MEPCEDVRKLGNKIRVFFFYLKLIEYKELRKLVDGALITGVRNGACLWNLV